MSKREQAAQVVTDADWAGSLAVWKAAIDMGKPDAIQAVKRQIEKLDGEMSALVNRRELVALACKQPEKLTDLERRFHLARYGEDQIDFLTQRIDEMEAKVKTLANLLRAVRMIKQEDDQETPEQRARPAMRDPIKTLEYAEKEEDRISHVQAAAARRIAAIFQAVTAAGQAKNRNIDGGAGGTGAWQEPGLPEDLADEYDQCFRPWGDHLCQHAPDTLAICKQVSVFGISLHACRVKAKIGRKAALGKLRDGLDRYADLYRQYRRNNDNAAY